MQLQRSAHTYRLFLIVFLGFAAMALAGHRYAMNGAWLFEVHIQQGAETHKAYLPPTSARSEECSIIMSL